MVPGRRRAGTGPSPTAGYFYVPGSQSSIAFFPVYPLGVRGLGGLLDDVQLAGSLLGVLAGLAAVLLFARWVWQRLPRRSAILAIAVLLVYPYSFFLYGAMYADSLFLLCAISAFVLLERRWYLAAGLVGALATAGRPVGIAVAAGLVVRTLEMLAESRRASHAESPSARDDACRRPSRPSAGATWSPRSATCACVISACSPRCSGSSRGASTSG